MIVVIMASWGGVRTPQTLVWEKAFYPCHRADVEWLRGVARVCVWLVHSSSTRDISQYASSSAFYASPISIHGVSQDTSHF